MRRFETVVQGVRLLKVPFNDGGYDTGVTLVQTGTRNLLIDSGECASTVDSCVIPALRELGIGRPDQLLCTHTHGDHIGGHKRLMELAPARTAVYRNDAADLPVPADLLLDDGDEVVPGLRLIAMPGHMKGAVGWLHTESGTLICGDSLQGAGTDGVGLALIEDAAAYRESIRRVMNIRPRRLVCGHGFAPCDFVIEGCMRVHAFLQCCLDTVQRYEAFVRSHADESVPDLTEKLVEAEKRTLPKYIVKGESTVDGLLRAIKETS